MVGILFAGHDMGLICRWHWRSLWCLGMEFEADSDDEAGSGMVLWEMDTDA